MTRGGERTFASRHIGPEDPESAAMLETLGLSTVNELADAVLPDDIRLTRALRLPATRSEAAVLEQLRGLAARNHPQTAMIGLGYHATVTPPVIRRNVLENPAWYTAYTPYQPEISQGRLEALLVFQTMVADLTGLSIAGASLLDEATAVAEAIALARRHTTTGSVVVLDGSTLPQTAAVVRTRCAAVGIRVVEALGSLVETLRAQDAFAVVVQVPGADGYLPSSAELSEVAAEAHRRGALVIAAADLLALTLVDPPSTWGADIAVGSTQRFGVPLFYGGPHAAYIAVRTGLERSLPGRLVGVSVDADGNPAYRLALQTREQHIRREKATSNICTAQVLLAVVASMYAVYHGPEGLRAIASEVHTSTRALAGCLVAAGHRPLHDSFFDTLTVAVPGRAADIVTAARQGGVHLRLVDAAHVGVSVGEGIDERDLEQVCASFSARWDATARWGGLAGNLRACDFLQHPVFSAYHSETEMLRYLRQLSGRDFALDRGMIPLGSCTMKLNATAELEPISYPGFANVHPCAPAEDALGYAELIESLSAWLAEITGYDRICLQPNAGSQGELAGLLAIRGYHRARGDEGRTVCLIPSSAHGTNAASATMAGMRVVLVKARSDGAIDLDEVRRTIAAYRDRLAAAMVTYPSTHGVFEESLGELCALVHEAGGQVYVDGANMNALVGLARPGDLGADVGHLNLHKTFAIPHGGGGPGVGPIGVKEHLAPHVPSHPFAAASDPSSSQGPVAAAPWGSAGILPITYAYIALLGPDGLRSATLHAVLAANYLAKRLSVRYPVLYTGRGGFVAHECILDLRPVTKRTKITVDDVAKRLIDYGFHAPTMSFPVPGTLMVEPTESESKREIDRFCDAMLAIGEEIDKVADGTWPADDNPLRNAPHTLAQVTADEWRHPYSRTEAGFPAGRFAGPIQATGRDKYWPAAARIDGGYGDRNLVCSCPPIEAYADQ